MALGVVGKGISGVTHALGSRVGKIANSTIGTKLVPPAGELTRNPLRSAATGGALAGVGGLTSLAAAGNGTTSDDLLAWGATAASVVGGALAVRGLRQGSLLTRAAAGLGGAAVGGTAAAVSAPVLARTLEGANKNTAEDEQHLAAAKKTLEQSPDGRRVLAELERRDVDIRMVDEIPYDSETLGSFNPVSNRIYLERGASAKDLGQILIHEGQHVINDRGAIPESLDTFRVWAGIPGGNDAAYKDEAQAYHTGATHWRDSLIAEVGEAKYERFFEEQQQMLADSDKIGDQVDAYLQKLPADEREKVLAKLEERDISDLPKDLARAARQNEQDFRESRSQWKQFENIMGPTSVGYQYTGPDGQPLAEAEIEGLLEQMDYVE